MKKIIPFVTCEVPFFQYVCKLVFAVDILESWDPYQFCETTSQEQLGGFLVHVSYRLNHGFVVLKKCAASDRIEKTSRSTKHNQHYSYQDYRAGLEPWFGFGCACLMWCYATSFLVLDLWCCWIGFGKKCNTSITKSQRSAC